MTKPITRTGKHYRLTCAVSLVANLFFIALIVGHLLHNDMAQDPTRSLTAALANAEAALSKPDAAAFSAVMRDDAPQFMGAAKQLGLARIALAQQIAAEPFNAAAVRQALNDYRGSFDQFEEQFSAPMIEALAKISPQGRRNLIAARRCAKTVGGL